MKTLSQIITLILICLFFLQGSIHAQYITRGAVEDEIYISSSTYLDGYYFHKAILYSTDNGENLSVKYENIENPPEGEMEPGTISSDATPCVLYNYGNYEFWVSFDYGKNWEYRGGANGRFATGNIEGEIYYCCENVEGTIWRSIDYGNSFMDIRDNFKFKLEVGNSEGVLYGFGGDAGVGYNLYYSKNYGLDFDTIPIDSAVAYSSVSGQHPKISRGVVSGELYLISWTPELHYKIFHSVDTGYTWEEKYESDFINIYYWGVDFTAGRKQGSLYVTRKTLDQTWNNAHIDLYIDYSEDYGETFTTYFHELDEYFPDGNYHNEILSFNFNDFEPPIIGEIDEENHRVLFTVPYGTDFTSLIPTIAVSPDASIEPASGIANDFSIPVIYTVTAENGDTQDYTIIGNMAENNKNFILSFNFEEFEPPVIGNIQEETKSIHLVVPHGTNLTELVPTITISENATVFPLSGVANNFTDTTFYTVTAQNGDEREYKVIVLDTVSAINDILPNSTINIFPNPSRDIINISSNGKLSNNSHLVIFDINGHSLKRKEINTTNSKTSIKINISNFNTGVYYLNIYKNGIRIETKRILLIK